MNKAVQSDEQGEGLEAGLMSKREQLSALVDGQLQGEDFRDALAHAAEAEGRSTWQVYHLVGDVLRSSDLAQPVSPDFMARLRVELAKEVPPGGSGVRAQQVTKVAPAVEAANASVFRWKMVAGFASLAAVAAISWSSLATLHSPGGPDVGGGAQLARPLEPVSSPDAASTVAVAEAEGNPVMIRDPRLDELLAAHKQFGSTSALQMPAGFLRNATFDSPVR